MRAQRIWKEERGILVCKDLPLDLPWAQRTLHYKVEVRAREGGEVLWVRPYLTRQEAIRAYYNLVGLRPAPLSEVVVMVATILTFNVSIPDNGSLDWFEGGTRCPDGVTEVTYLAVAGGGGGGTGGSNCPAAGGGGGGGMLEGITPVVPGTNYNIFYVGLGGNPKNAGTITYVGVGGFPPIINTTGGGYGGSHASAPLEDNPEQQATNAQAGNGGCGGGGGGQSSYPMDVPGGTGMAGQGFAGGSGRNYTSGPELDDPAARGTFIVGGGGGGAGAVGGYPALGLSQGGAGGAGRSSLITGVDLRYGGGGGGAAAGVGTDGGGNGGNIGTAGLASTAVNRGCGGGGGSSAPGGQGSAGVLVMSITLATGNQSRAIFIM